MPTPAVIPRSPFIPRTAQPPYSHVGDPPARPPPGRPSGGGGSRAAPPPPPRQAGPPAAGRTRRPGLPRDPDQTRTPGGNAPATKGGLGKEPQATPPREREGEPRRDAPLCPPTPPHRPAGPHPPGGRGDDPPSPRQDRGAREGGRSRTRPPAPAACSRRKHERQANPRQHATAPHRPRPGTASEHEPERYGDHALHGRATPRTPALLPAQGRQRDGPRQSDPPPHCPPRPHSWGAGRAGRPPHPSPPLGAGTPQTRRPTPRRAHSPKSGRGETGSGRPPPPKTNHTGHGTGAGHTQLHGPR